MPKLWRTREENLFKKFLLLKRGYMAKLKITQTRSIIDRPERQKKIIEALGLGRPHWEKIHNDTPQIRGMLKKVPHLVKVEEVKE
jgi:large subunit ribosomal protein L30